MVTSSKIKQVLMVAPRSTGGNFEYVAIPRQGLLFLSGALEQWKGDFLYERDIWFEDRSGNIDPDKDLENADILMVTALINEAPRAYEIARSARNHHPTLPMIGGGPHMSPLAEEAIREGGFDVIVQREGEDIIGSLCDILLRYDGAELTAELYKFPGISFLDQGQFVQTPRRGVVAPDFVELPDFASVRDLTPQNPMAAGVMETVRGCTEKCTYCQVIQQFLGYRMIRRETELKRLAQLRGMAEDGLIHAAKDGRFSVFVSDDLHPPPLRAVKYRDERVARLRNWKGHSDGMWMIAQARGEIGQDPELAKAMWEAGFRMLYLGVESSNAKNLDLVKKRQDPTQVHKDLVTLNEMGFAIAAMTIIGLPFDTEETIMEMADWVKTVSRYQTANLLTPLPATINWSLTPLDEDGSLLPEGKLRPYHLYTGRQFVHHDERWTMQESQDLFDRYTSRLRPVDKLYERVFTLLRRTQGKVVDDNSEVSQRVAAQLGRIGTSVSSRIGQLEDNLTPILSRLRESLSSTISQWEESVSDSLSEWEGYKSARVGEVRKLIAARSRDLRETMSARLGELSDTLVSTTGELRSTWLPRIAELRQTVLSKTGEFKENVPTRAGSLRNTVASRATELGDTLCATLNEFARKLDSTPTVRTAPRPLSG